MRYKVIIMNLAKSHKLKLRDKGHRDKKLKLWLIILRESKLWDH